MRCAYLDLPMHNRTVSPENTNGRVRLGNLTKYTPTDPDNSWLTCISRISKFEHLLRFGLYTEFCMATHFNLKDTEYLFVLRKVRVQLDATFLVTYGLGFRL